MLFNEPVGFRLSSKVRTSLESIVYYPFHMHENVIEILCIVNGTITVCNSALDYELSFGDVYIINPKEPHKIFSDDPENIILTIQIDRDHYSRFYEGFDLIYFVCGSNVEQDHYAYELRYLRFLLAKLYTEYNKQNPSDIFTEELVKVLFNLLIQQFQYYTYKKTENGEYRIVRRRYNDYNKQYLERIYKIIDYIYDKYNTKLTLHDVAAREFLSTSHLSRYIKKYSGLSFSELLSLARCEEAERLLCITDKTVDQIATDVGFSNRNHLTVQFKKWFSKTPAQYRKSIMADLDNSSNIQFKTFDYDFAQLIIGSYLNGY
ncbi:MAG: AraC family transcriptional regulator [Eubacteriales bacterium]|nr:AraC family transcriptional regulator [Eubacteriales bacterium]